MAKQRQRSSSSSPLCVQNARPLLSKAQRVIDLSNATRNMSSKQIRTTDAGAISIFGGNEVRIIDIYNWNLDRYLVLLQLGT